MRREIKERVKGREREGKETTRKEKKYLRMIQKEYMREKIRKGRNKKR